MRTAANQLLTFKSVSGDVFDETLRLAQDLSATGFGNIEQAAVQIGKALEDPIEGLGNLKDVGISFTAAQTELITKLYETGQVAAAQGKILEQIAAQVGGAGAAAGGGVAGAFQRLTEGMGLWLLVIGQAAAEGIGLEAILKRMASGTEISAAAMDPSVLGLEGMKTELARVREEIAATEAALAAMGTKGRVGSFVEGSEVGAGLAGNVELDELRAREAQLTASIAEEEAAQTEVRKQAAAEQAEIARERFEHVLAGLEAERQALHLTELQQAQLDAVREAGAQGDATRTAAIEAKVAQIFAEKAALEAAAEAQAAADAAAAGGPAGDRPADRQPADRDRGDAGRQSGDGGDDRQPQRARRRHRGRDRGDQQADRRARARELDRRRSPAWSRARRQSCAGRSRRSNITGIRSGWRGPRRSTRRGRAGGAAPAGPRYRNYPRCSTPRPRPMPIPSRRRRGSGR